MLSENVENWFIEAQQRGKREGKLEGKLEQAIQMIRDFNLPVREVAEKYKLSLKDLMDRLNQDEKPKS